MIGVTINHEEMTDLELDQSIGDHHRELDLPVTDPLTRPGQDLVDMVLLAFPELAPKAAPETSIRG